MRYILLPNEQACKDLSRAIYRIRAPESLTAGSGTMYWFPWLKHPTLDQWAMLFDEAGEYEKHPATDAMLTDPTDQYGSRAMTAATFLPIAADGINSLQAIMALVLASNPLLFADVLPHVNPALVKTHAEMDADGWFPEPVL